ncbi:MAG TPA: oligopeptide transporter, OPT family [Rhodanobacteraceae bacterium]|jgi:putative OPT family oligopeptide transporter|nr:oligopeptide transporter, OPT family [Rhodanobacteraceae bacterium]
MNAISGIPARRELTVRGVIIGIVITIVFTAANVYFGLKAGLTFSTSIPAAVISMAVLKAMADATIQENNIVQTVASAAGTLSSIIFVLPGLVIVGYWSGFPFWVTAAICATGGILGVMYTIPLRRALVTDSDLPYPEGVACAEVLKVGAGEAAGDGAAQVETGGAGLKAVLWGAIVSAVFYLIVQTRVFAASVTSYFRVGGEKGGATGFDFGLSFALFAIGHLVGLWVGVAMLVGALIGWAWAVPHYASHFLALVAQGGHLDWTPAKDLADLLSGSAVAIAGATWKHSVRFIGAGAIGVAAIWTLAKLVKPLVSGLAGALRASRARKAGTLHTLPITEHDIPIGTVGIVSLICLVPIGYLLWHFSVTNGLGGATWTLVIGGIAFVVLLSFLVSAVCGYMAGLIGSSNSPLSGVGILVVVIAALLLVAGVKPFLPADAGKALVGFALFITSIVFAVASIANNNLQDLKTGQLVEATPSKQQWALVIGVLVGAAVIPPVMDLLQHAFGFAGAPGAGPNALPAPQAGLISALAQGVITGNVPWDMIGLGAGIGVAIIIFDELLGLSKKKGTPRLPPLAVGLGIYLPTSTTLMVVVGALVGAWFDRRAEKHPNAAATKQLGVLLASGLIVGESLLAVIFAGIIAFSGKSSPIGLVGAGFETPSIIIGGIVFAITVAILYRWIIRMARPAA